MAKKLEQVSRIGIKVGGRHAGFRLADVTMPDPMPKGGAYDKALLAQQYRLRAIELSYRRFGHRALIALEGWDASGKGGVIRRMTAYLDPRGTKVWPIGPPKAEDQARHYLYRFFTLVPEPGELAVFDRSWYGRVLVERVENLVPKDDWNRAYREINQFERLLINDGARIIKVFLHITPDEQLRRFQERVRSPYKRWKITPEDLRNRARWADYETAIDEMIERTATSRAPWHVIAANDKRHARIATMEIIADALSAGVEISPPPLDPEVARVAKAELGIDPEG